MPEEFIDAEYVDENLITCRNCGKKNRLRSLAPDTRCYCGSCHAILMEPSHPNHGFRFATLFRAVIFGKRKIVFAFSIMLILAFTVFLFQPWTQFRWAVLQNTVSGYEKFIARNPFTTYTPSARERIRLLKDDTTWGIVLGSNEISQLRDYLQVYPDGKHIAEAKNRYILLAEHQWHLLAKSRSEAKIRQFLMSYPESTKIGDAENRIQELYNDFSWVQEQNTLEDYKRYLNLNPHAANHSAIEKKIIDLEVAAIVATDHELLPSYLPTIENSQSSHAEIHIENGTKYELTVRYSGPDSQKIILPAGATKSISLETGAYTVAASVSASNVTNYAGTDSMQGGKYEVRFYIDTIFSQLKR